MKATKELHNFGQSIWIDNITRNMLTSGTLQRYIDDFSVTGLTSNPTIFDQDITQSPAYDDEIRRLVKQGCSGESLFFELALDDLTQAADLFAPVHERTAGVDGWVSLEVSPVLAHDAASTVTEAKALFRKARRPNLFIKIPGTKEGAAAIEESIYSGVPINVTLLFSAEQYRAAAEAYMRGLERRLAEGLRLDVRSVASIFVSRWDKATAEKVPPVLRNRLGLAVAQQTYKTYRDLLDSDRWQRLENHGARPQRLLFASTGTKDPAASDVLYINALTAPHTINTMPEKTLLAFDDHGKIGGSLPRNCADADKVVAAFAEAGVDADTLAVDLQEEGAKAFSDSWYDLLNTLRGKARDSR